MIHYRMKSAREACRGSRSRLSHLTRLPRVVIMTIGNLDEALTPRPETCGRDTPFTGVSRPQVAPARHSRAPRMPLIEANWSSGFRLSLSLGVGSARFSGEGWSGCHSVPYTRCRVTGGEVRSVGKRRKVGNLLALPLLTAFLERPMHPYEVATMLRERGKDQDVKFNWGSLYTVVDNLAKNGFIEAVRTEQEGRRPERAVSRITPGGRAELVDWVRELVAVPRQEYPAFKTALSNLPVLTPDEAIELLRLRVVALRAEIAGREEALVATGEFVPRLFVIESEYHLALCRAELEWIGMLLAELTEGTLPGLDGWRHYHEKGEWPGHRAERPRQGRKHRAR